MITYDFYKSRYHGSSISESEWPMFEARAAEQLAYYRQIYTVTARETVGFDESGNATIHSDVIHVTNENDNVTITVPVPFAMAICAMADVYAAIADAQNGTGTVSSSSIGSVSVSYSQVASLDLSPRGQSRELYNAACRYLQIYRGC